MLGTNVLHADAFTVHQSHSCILVMQ